jgi:2',3'-cyclic-nucleotide 2'-phosphodiesterase (5'-nucleotidase family)
MIRQTRFALWIALLIALTGIAQPQYVTILHFNDFHGQLLPVEGKDKAETGGMARLATMVKETRAWNGPHHVTTLLLEAGDILQGTPLSTVFHGEPDFTCLNMMGVDVMTVGNHEVDFGQDNLKARGNQARFPIISANIRYADTKKPLAPPTVAFDVGGVKALIFGLTSKDTPIESAAKNVVGLEFLDPTDVARQIVEANRDQYPIIIALTHIGLNEDLALAKAVPGIDIIIGAHSHDAVQEPMQVGDTLVCQAGSKGAYLGQLDAFFANGDVAKYRGFLRPTDATVKPDPAVAKIVQTYADRLGSKIKRVVATSKAPLNGDRDTLRSRETNLGDLLSDLCRTYAQADVALLNGGGIRASIDEGPITVEEIMVVLPFGNQVATVEVTGAVLLEALQHNASLPRPDGGFLQVSGLSMVIRGKDVRDVKVGGQPLDPAKTYKVVLPDFLLTGGNGFTMFAKGTDPRFLGTTIDAIVLEGLETLKTVDPKVDGRIVVEE